MKAEENAKLITLKELARIVGVAERTVQTLVKEGHLTCQKVGKYNYYSLYQMV